MQPGIRTAAGDTRAAAAGVSGIKLAAPPGAAAAGDTRAAAAGVSGKKFAVLS